MAHHYKSDCKQCYRYQQCKNEQRNIDLAEQRVEDFKMSSKPFIPFFPHSRKNYQKWWSENGMPIGMSNHDCFKSIGEHDRDIKSKEKSQLKESGGWK